MEMIFPILLLTLVLVFPVAMVRWINTCDKIGVEKARLRQAAEKLEM